MLLRKKFNFKVFVIGFVFVGIMIKFVGSYFFFIRFNVNIVIFCFFFRSFISEFVGSICL